MSEGAYCLKWSEFERNLGSTFSSLRTDPAFTDVTLACRGGQVEAHKVILAAASPFFANILQRNPHSHPLIYLKDTEAGELAGVVDFMYCGEAQVAREGLEAFLATARDLQVKGLVTAETENLRPVKNEAKTHELRKSASPTHEVKEDDHDEKILKDWNDNQPNEIKEDVQMFFENKPTVTEYRDLEKFIIKSKGSVGKNQKALHECSLCGKTNPKKAAMMTHVESAHFSGKFTHSCKICGKVSKTKGSLKQHHWANHKKSETAAQTVTKAKTEGVTETVSQDEVTTKIETEESNVALSAKVDIGGRVETESEAEVDTETAAEIAKEALNEIDAEAMAHIMAEVEGDVGVVADVEM